MTAGAPAGRFALLPAGTAPEAALLLGARALRAFGDGLISLLLPVHLARLGFGPVAIGALATATLAGSAALTLTVGLAAHRLPMGRAPLLGAAVLMVATGLAFPLAREFWPLFLIAFVGTINPSSGDVSVFLPLEQARLVETVPDHGRTALFARYSLIGSLAAAVGSLCAGAPELLASVTGIDPGVAIDGASACCSEASGARNRPSPVGDQATRTEFGRPRSSMRLRTATPMATSVACA